MPIRNVHVHEQAAVYLVRPFGYVSHIPTFKLSGVWPPGCDPFALPIIPAPINVCDDPPFAAGPINRIALSSIPSSSVSCGRKPRSATPSETPATLLGFIMPEIVTHDFGVASAPFTPPASCLCRDVQ